MTASATTLRPGWPGFLRAFVSGSVLIVVSLWGFVLALDPYGTRTGPDRRPTPIMDLNGRYMYPQLARSGLFDAAVFGTSTIRLLDPQRLSDAFGVRLANLGLNAGTPWEQVQLAGLFVRHVPRPELLVFGLDRNWCEPDADAPARRLTFRSFPPWLYDENPLNDLVPQLDLKSVEIASRVALHRLGLMPERIRRDGYEVFTPPEARYDLGQARRRIWEGTSGHVEARVPPVELDAGERAALRFPALAWLDELLARVPRETRIVLILPPIHVAAQAAPGSYDAAIDAECKARIAVIAGRHRAAALDFRLPSPLTLDDANYWDKLHYRLPVAARLVDDLKTAVDTRRDATDGTYRVLSGSGG